MLTGTADDPILSLSDERVAELKELYRLVASSAKKLKDNPLDSSDHWTAGHLRFIAKIADELRANAETFSKAAMDVKSDVE